LDLRSVVVLSLDSYGDLTLREPLFRSLLDAGLDVTAVVREPADRLLPYLDARLAVEVTDLNPYVEPDASFWVRARALLDRIARRAPDRLVCGLYNRTFLDQWLLRSSAVPTIGFANPALSDEGVLDLLSDAPARFESSALGEQVAVEHDAPEIDKNRALLSALGVPPVDPFVPRLRVPIEDERRAGELLAAMGLAPGRYAFASPVGGANNPLKAWPAASLAPLVEHLRVRHGLSVLLTGIEGERPLLSRLQEACHASGGEPPPIWTGGSLEIGTLLGLIAQCRVYVGVDTGPMHFAAALRRPVLALFGGGHWPRFLPVAGRSAVATRRLPCFGCDWDCFLEEPACVTSVRPEALIDCADWLLANDEPGTRVESGSPLPDEPARLLREAAGRHRQNLAELRQANRHRALLADQLRSSEEARRQLHAWVESSEADKRELLSASERERAAYLATLQAMEVRAQSMQQQIAHLHTPKAAVRVLTAAGLRKAGIFDAVHRRRGWWKRRPGQPEGDAPEMASSEAPAARLSLLDAFVLARSMPGDTADLALEKLHHLGVSARRALCLPSTPGSAQAAVMLASGGAEVTCVGEPPFAAPPGIRATGVDLGEWLASSGGSSLPGTDLLFVDAAGDRDTVRLLNGRVPAQAMVVVAGAHEVPGSPIGPPDQAVAGLSIYNAPPSAWLDPAPDAPARREQPGSPVSSALRFAALLPSGRAWPRITVVTPSFNHAAFLEQTLQSVLGQGYPALQYIVVDGGSTDGTHAILDRYRGRLDRCIVGEDEGQADALNKGFAHATGEILAWLNSDDRYAPGALWRAAVAFDAFGTDLVAGGCRLVNDGSEEPIRTHHSSLPIGRVVPLPLDRILDLDGSWLKGDFFFQPEVFWTRAMWDRCGARVAKELHYSMDYELWVRMAMAGASIVHVPDTLAIYRVHDRQKTAGDHLPYLPELRSVVASVRGGQAAP
jgi:GT2 family glycosyltransferase